MEIAVRAGAFVLVGKSALLVGGTGVAVTAGKEVAIAVGEDTTVAVGGSGVAVSGTSVFVGGTDVSVDWLCPQPMIRVRRIVAVAMMRMTRSVQRVDMVLLLAFCTHFCGVVTPVFQGR